VFFRHALTLPLWSWAVPQNGITLTHKAKPTDQIYTCYRAKSTITSAPGPISPTANAPSRAFNGRLVSAATVTRSWLPFLGTFLILLFVGCAEFYVHSSRRQRNEHRCLPNAAANFHERSSSSSSSSFIRIKI